MFDRIVLSQMKSFISKMQTVPDDQMGEVLAFTALYRATLESQGLLTSRLLDSSLQKSKEAIILEKNLRSQATSFEKAGEIQVSIAAWIWIYSVRAVDDPKFTSLVKICGENWCGVFHIPKMPLTV